MNLGKLLFTYEGRINRAKYWLAGLLCLVVMLAAALLAKSLGYFETFFGAAMFGWIVVGIPSAFLGIKRLHDRDKSGWWLLLFYVAPTAIDYIGAVITGTPIDAEGTAATLPFTLAGAAISIWALVELGFLRGTAGPNRYGPDPLAASLGTPDAGPRPTAT